MVLSFCPKCKTKSAAPAAQCANCGAIYDKLNQSDALKSAAAAAATGTSSKKSKVHDDDKTFNNFKFVIILFIVAGAIFAGKLYRDKKMRVDRAKAVGRTTEPSFVVIGVEDRAFYEAVTSLKMRSANVEVRKFNSQSELEQDAQLVQAMKASGANSLPLPAVQMDGKFITERDEMDALLLDSYPKYFEREKDTAYVVVYGTDDDPFTQSTLDVLRAKKIPLEYRNMNVSAEMAGYAEARLHASGFKKRNYKMPIVDVNGYVRPQLATSEIESRFASNQ